MVFAAHYFLLGSVIRLEVSIPEVKVHVPRTFRILSPELQCVKPDAVDTLSLRTQSERIGVRKDVASVHQMDHSVFSSCISWQARVTRRVNVPGTYAVANREARGGAIWLVQACCRTFKVLSGPRFDFRIRPVRYRPRGIGLVLSDTRFQFFLADYSELQKSQFGPLQPAPVVGEGEVNLWRQLFQGVSGSVYVGEHAQTACGAQGIDMALPWLMEDRLVRLDWDRPEAVHPSHVVHTVHAVVILFPAFQPVKRVLL